MKPCETCGMETDCEHRSNGAKPAPGSVEELKKALGILSITIDDDGNAEIGLTRGSIFAALMGKLQRIENILGAKTQAKRMESGIIVPR